MAYRAVPAVVPPATATGSPPALVFETGSAFQSDWLGVCANYMGFANFSALGLSGAQQTAEFTRAQTSGIKIARTAFQPEWAYASWPSGSPDYNSADMASFKVWLTAMQAAGIKVILTMGWHYPGSVCGTWEGGTDTTCTPTPTNEATWATWVSASLNHLINDQGYTNIFGCFFFTEPAAVGNIPNGYTYQTYYARIVGIARAKIVSDDASRTPILPRIYLMGAEEFSFTDFTLLTYLRANADSTFDMYTAHSYCQTPTFAPYGLAASNCAAYTAWNTLFSTAVSTASPKGFIADETGTLVGGDSDSTNYRKTADWGWQLARQIEGHMEAGCKASMPWMLQDQRWYFDPVTNFLEYGVAGFIGDSNAVHPSWYAFTMLANLTGGGSGTKLYRLTTGGTSTLHGVAAWIPQGVRLATNADGEWTFVVVNESANPVKLPVSMSAQISTSGRTFYRYTYSGEIPPTSAADPAYLLPWDMQFTGIRDGIPATTIPARSVVCFSTINMAAGATNLALSAIASTDSTGLGACANVNDGNFSNVQGSSNGWKKHENASHYVELTWPSAVSVARVRLAFVGTTAGVVYATYTDTTTPSPVADYTAQYWNGSAFADFSTPINVTGNTAPNKEHTFNAVSTTKIRLTVTSAAATGQVNQLGVYGA